MRLFERELIKLSDYEMISIILKYPVNIKYFCFLRELKAFKMQTKINIYL